MRNDVLKFLQNLPSKKEQQFNQAFELLKKAPGVQFAQIRSYNVLGVTQSNINNILYDLKKLYGISEVEIRSKKVIKEIEFSEKVIETANQIIDAVANNDSAPKNSLHDIFPFLKDKNCPHELLIVSGQVVASWKRYQELKQQVDKISAGEMEVTEEEDLRITAACAKEFEDNQALYKELEHYKEHKELLGEHEILKEYRIQKEIDAMTTEELVKYQKNSAPYLSKARKELEKEGLTEDKKVLILERIADREKRLELVNKKLGING